LAQHRLHFVQLRQRFVGLLGHPELTRTTSKEPCSK
jgi:hypothetical protein